MFSTLSKAVIIIFDTFVVYKCYEFGLVQNFVVWEWVKAEQCLKISHIYALKYWQAYIVKFNYIQNYSSQHNKWHLETS